MPRPRTLQQYTGAFLTAVSGGALVAAFLPAVDARALLQGMVENEAFARFALAGLSALGMTCGFLLFARSGPTVDLLLVAESAPAAAVATATPHRAMAAREPAAARPATAGPVAPLSALDTEIKGLNRKINKARVELGMGRLSPAGYSAYVGTLTAERAKLEKQRLAIELKGPAAKPPTRGK